MQYTDFLYICKYSSIKLQGEKGKNQTHVATTFYNFDFARKDGIDTHSLQQVSNMLVELKKIRLPEPNSIVFIYKLKLHKLENFIHQFELNKKQVLCFFTFNITQ